MQRISRRRFLKGAAAGTAGLWIATSAGLRWASALEDPDPSTFRYGVASGDPAPDRVIIWTHVTPPSPNATSGVRWEVATDPGFTQGSVVRSGVFTTGPDRDHTVKVDVDALAPGTEYWYRFHAVGATSRIGRTKTAPAPGTGETLAFALASCQHFRNGYYAAWRHIAAREDLDLVLQVGDYIYEGGNGGDGVRDHVPDHEIIELAHYRTRYANYRSDLDLRNAHAMHPFVVAMDDHEVANNSWRDGAQAHGDSEGDYRKRRAAAFQAYDEWQPIRLPEGRNGADTRFYRELPFGGLADVFMLDTRQYRDEQTSSPFPTPGPQTNPDNADPDRTYLGEEQKAWLKDRLSASGARWKILGNQAMLAQFTYGAWPDEVSTALQDLTGMPPDGFTVNSDQWDGYQAEQKEMLRHFGTVPGNVLVCTGDIHMSFANEVYVDEGKFRVEAPVAAEFVGSSITSSNFNDTLGIPPRTGSIPVEQVIKAGNPHIRWCELDSNGYVVVRLTDETARGEWWHLRSGREDEPIRDPDATEVLATAWEARDGDLTLEWVGGQPVATV